MKTRLTHPSITRALAVVGGLAAAAAIGFAPTAASAAPDELVVSDLQPVPVEEAMPRPTAGVNVDCDATDRVSVQIGNHTDAAFLVDTYLDGDLVDSEYVNPDAAHIVALPLAENETRDVVVAVGAEPPLIDESVSLDCLLPEPSYEIIQDCDNGQVYARLVNHGADTAWIGVQYPDVVLVEIEIGPHASQDWLLAVPDDGPVSFEVVSSGVSLGSEVFEFTCPVVSAVSVPSEPSAPALDAADAAPVQPITEPAFSPTATDVAPIPVDLEVDDSADAVVGEEEIASAVELELVGSGRRNGLAIGVAMVLIGLTMLGGVVVAISSGRRR